MDTVNGLTPQAVITPQDVELLRVIRNTCRSGFSHDTEEISPGAQRDWWLRYRQFVVALLYFKADAAWAPVGYGVLRQNPAEGKWYSSVAVLPDWTGHGYGKAITAHIIRQCPDDEVYASARLDNPAARALHQAVDWEVTGSDERLEYYRTRRDLGAWAVAQREAVAT